MTDTPSGGGMFSQIRDNPATKGLFGALGDFASAQAGSLAKSATDKMTGDTPASGAMKGASEATQEGKSGLFGGIKGAIKGLFKKGGGSAKRPTTIYEDLLIGVPIEDAYANWTQYSKFPEFMKGPESVRESNEEASSEEGEEGSKPTVQWTAKIFLNRRSWKATIEEDIENYRIRWTTEGAKGTIDGVVTFHQVTDTLTAMVYVLEYRPKGFFEWWGNRWRTVGRRARLDVKHFGRYVMMQDRSQEQDQAEDTGEQEQPEGEQPPEEQQPDNGPITDDNRPEDENDPEPESEEPA